MAPVADAVHLVDDEQPDGAEQGGHHIGSELRVVEALGGDEEEIDLSGVDGVEDRFPVVPVR